MTCITQTNLKTDDRVVQGIHVSLNRPDNGIPDLKTVQ